MSTILKTRTINNGALSVGFIPSANVKVFPCAYRGYINDSGTSVGIDPESKANTEYNYVNMYSKLGTTKPSYVISNISNTLKCIIGGYYFEITGLGQEDFIETITDANNNVSYSKKYLVLNTKPIPMPASETDSSRSTKVLKSLIDENVDYLDTKIDDTYYFVGLAVANTITGFEASLAPFTVDEAAPQNWEAKTIYDVLDTGVGAYSLRSLCSNASEDNEAQNKHSIALGEGSKAYSDYQIVLGKYNNHIKSTSTDDDGNTVYNYYDDVVIVGNGSSDSRSNSFRLSKEGNINTIGTVTAAKKLTISSEGADITGVVDLKGNTTIGTDNNTANLTVTGSTTINNNLSVAGNIYLNNTDEADSINPSNNLILGKYETTTVTSTDPETEEETTTTLNISSSGSISVYGQEPTSETDKVFSVSNTGKTYIDDITDATTTDGALKVAGGARINKKLDVGSNAAIGGTLKTMSTTTSGGKLTVSADGADITGNVEIKSGTLKSAKKLTVESEGAEITGGLTVTSNGIAVTGNSSIDGTFEVSNNTDLNGTLAVEGTTTLENGTINFIDESNSLVYDSADKRFELNQPLHVTGELTATKKTVLAGCFEATTTGITVGTTSSTKTTTLNGDTTINGTTDINGQTNITGAVNINTDNTADPDDINIYGKTTVNGGLIVKTGESSNVEITGNTEMTGTLEVSSTTKLKENVEISGTAEIGGKTTIGTASDALNLEVTGKAEISGTLELPFNGTGLIVGKSATIGNMSINTTISGSGETETKSTSISGINSISATGNISTAGSITTTNGNIKTESGYVEGQYFNATSDRRLKQNIEDYKCEKSILELPIKKYEFINNPGKIHIGCIAQDLQEICPEIVSEDEKGYLSIQENKLIYLLLQEIKELKARIEKLENK